MELEAFIDDVIGMYCINFGVIPPCRLALLLLSCSKGACE